MKFISVLAAALSPSALTAAPVADGAAEGYENATHSVAELVTSTAAARDTTEELFKPPRTFSILGIKYQLRRTSHPVSR